MSFVAREVEKLSRALCENPRRDNHTELYAAQQALAWALDPKAVASPYNLLTGMSGDSTNCSEGNYLVLLPDSLVPKSGAA